MVAYQMIDVNAHLAAVSEPGYGIDAFLCALNIHCFGHKIGGAVSAADNGYVAGAVNIIAQAVFYSVF